MMKLFQFSVVLAALFLWHNVAANAEKLVRSDEEEGYDPRHATEEGDPIIHPHGW